MALVATSLLASCKKNDTQNKDTFTANIEGNDSKTYLSGLDVKWSSYDQIKVSNSVNTNITFELTEGEGGQKGTFYTGDSRKEAFFTAGGPYTAVYPAINPSDTANAISGTKATIYLPQEQRLIPAQTTTDGSSTLAGETGGLTFGVGYNPMVAYSGSQTLPFHNLLGGLCFPLKGAGTGSDTFHITKIVLTAINPADILWGKAEVECNPANANYLEMDLTNSKGSKHQLTLICDIDLPSSEVHKFFFMLPPGTLTWGLNVKVYDGEAVLYEEESDWHETPESPILCNQLQLTNPNMEIGRIPSVTTSTISNLKALEVTFSGANDNGGDANGVTRGFCWSTTNPPTIADNYVEVGSGTGSYNIRVTTLNPVTQYYWCAYATNSQGTSYGEVKSFTTMKDGFTINASGDKVYVAETNLVYKGSAGSGNYQASDYNKGAYFCFADNAYTVIGTAQANDNLKQDRDLFGFGASGYNLCFPFFTSASADKYRKYSFALTKDITDPTSYSGMGTTNYPYYYDWGHYNAIYHPGCSPTGSSTDHEGSGVWRTPSRDEFLYLLNTRTASTITSGETTTTDARYARAIVGTMKGLILFPDTYNQPGDITIENINISDFEPSSGHNSFTVSEWNTMQDKGAVFLPIGNYRNGTSVGTENVYGNYWTSTYDGEGKARYLNIKFGGGNAVNCPTHPIYYGLFVRLIRDY